MTAFGPANPAAIIASFQGRTINHFTDLAGAIGIAGRQVQLLVRGQSLVIAQAHFGIGTNPYLAMTSGNIFVTDLPITASLRQLAHIGVFGEKQGFVISMGEGDIFTQGVRITWTAPTLGIGTIPGGTTVQGPLVVTRR